VGTLGADGLALCRRRVFAPGRPLARRWRRPAAGRARAAGLGLVAGRRTSAVRRWCRHSPHCPCSGAVLATGAVLAAELSLGPPGLTGLLTLPAALSLPPLLAMRPCCRHRPRWRRCPRCPRVFFPTPPARAVIARPAGRRRLFHRLLFLLRQRFIRWPAAANAFLQLWRPPATAAPVSLGRLVWPGGSPILGCPSGFPAGAPSGRRLPARVASSPAPDGCRPACPTLPSRERVLGLAPRPGGSPFLPIPHPPGALSLCYAPAQPGNPFLPLRPPSQPTALAALSPPIRRSRPRPRSCPPTLASPATPPVPALRPPPPTRGRRGFADPVPHPSPWPLAGPLSPSDMPGRGRPR
jgi:hypothetical protein